MIKVVLYDDDRRRMCERRFPNETPIVGDIILINNVGYVVVSRTWMESEPTILMVVKAISQDLHVT